MRFKSSHAKAERAIGLVHELLNAAHVQIEEAVKHNTASRQAHARALQFHTEKLSETHTQEVELGNLLNSLPPRS